MSSRYEDIRDFAIAHYLTALCARFADRADVLLTSLLPLVRDVLESVDYESISSSLVIFLGDAAPAAMGMQGGMSLSDVTELPMHNQGTLTVQRDTAGDLTLWLADGDPSVVSQSSFAYRFTPGAGEEFWVDGQRADEPMPTGYPILGLARFKSLEESFDTYRIRVARHSHCETLAGSWREEHRVMFHPSPEAGLRRSLAKFLRQTLAEGVVDVTEESPTSDEDPVDITVRWSGSNRVALIEVKWLGKSGSLDPDHVTKDWTEARAKDGLQQIADYLDQTRERTQLHDVRGYLAIFDARRRNVKADTKVCTREDGLHFVGAEIEFQPELLQRHDMGAPVRLFCEPRWVTGSPSRSRRTRTKEASAPSRKPRAPSKKL